MVHATAVDGLKSGRLRVGVVGGGRNAFIGAVHWIAKRLDNLIELKAGALSSDAENVRVGADRRAFAEKSATLTPNVLDGARGVAFIEAAVKSSENNGVWTSTSFD